jgi:hypothetical protein
MKKPTKIKTEDGYSFFLLADGRYADSLVEENIDMSWNSFEEVISAFHAEEIDYHVYFNKE